MCLIKPNKLQASSGAVFIRAPSTTARKSGHSFQSRANSPLFALDRLLRRRETQFLFASLPSGGALFGSGVCYWASYISRRSLFAAATKNRTTLCRFNLSFLTATMSYVSFISFVSYCGIGSNFGISPTAVPSVIQLIQGRVLNL